MIDANALRSLIREVIAQEVRAHPSAPAAGQVVRVASDADLSSFARLVLTLAEEPAKRQAIANGTFPFRLEGSGPAPTTVPTVGSAHRIDQGPVTETML